MMISNYKFNALSSCSLYMYLNVFHFRYCCYVTRACTHSMQCKILQRIIVKKAMVNSISLTVADAQSNWTENMHNLYVNTLPICALSILLNWTNEKPCKFWNMNMSVNTLHGIDIWSDPLSMSNPLWPNYTECKETDHWTTVHHWQSIWFSQK